MLGAKVAMGAVRFQSCKLAVRQWWVRDPLSTSYVWGVLVFVKSHDITRALRQKGK